VQFVGLDRLTKLMKATENGRVTYKFDIQVVCHCDWNADYVDVCRTLGWSCLWL